MLLPWKRVLTSTMLFSFAPIKPSTYIFGGMIDAEDVPFLVNHQKILKDDTLRATMFNKANHVFTRSENIECGNLACCKGNMKHLMDTLFPLNDVTIDNVCECMQFGQKRD